MSAAATCCSSFSSAGLHVLQAVGAYYVMTDISPFGFDDDVAFARHLVKDVGVAAVPGSSFYRNAAPGRTKLRFCFSKSDETMHEADRRMTTKFVALVRRAAGYRRAASPSSRAGGRGR